MRFAYLVLGLVKLASLRISTASSCSNGVPGLQGVGTYEEICCKESCAVCDDWLFFDVDCTASFIAYTAPMCSVSKTAPCVIDTPALFCSNGVPGLQGVGIYEDICCKESCAVCDDWLFVDVDCTASYIAYTAPMCSVSKTAPCVIDPTGAFCSNGVPGVQTNDICCEAECGTCGGIRCDLLLGGAEACCAGAIQRSGVMCSTTSEAPCIVDDGPVEES